MVSGDNNESIHRNIKEKQSILESYLVANIRTLHIRRDPVVDLRCLLFVSKSLWKTQLQGCFCTCIWDLPLVI